MNTSSDCFDDLISSIKNGGKERLTKSDVVAYITQWSADADTEEVIFILRDMGFLRVVTGMLTPYFLDGVFEVNYDF